MTARIQRDPRIVLLLIVAAFVAACLLEVTRAHGQDFVSPPVPLSVQTIDTAIPRAADPEPVTPTPTPTPEPTDPFLPPTIVKPKLLFLTCRNSASFMWTNLAAKEDAAMAKLQEKYEVIQVCIPGLPAIVDIDANKLYTPDPCTLYYGCAPIAGLMAALEANGSTSSPQVTPTPGGVAVPTAAKRDAKAHNLTAPQVTDEATAPPITSELPQAIPGSQPVPRPDPIGEAGRPGEPLP